ALIKALAFLIDPLLFRLGEFALEGALAGLFSWVVKQPVLALLDLHRYVVAGGILFTILASLLCYPLLYFLTKKYRKAVLRWTETSPAFASFTRFPLIKFLTWLLMGKKKGDYAEMLELRKSPIRKGAVVLLVSLVAMVWIFGAIFGDTVAKAGFEGGLSRVTQSDVKTRVLNLSLLKGRLNLEDLRVYERREEKGIVSAVMLSSDLSVLDLLRKHLVFDEIKIQNMDFRVERDEKGRLNIGKKTPKKPAEKRAGKKEDRQGLHDFWKQKDLARDVIEKVLDFLFVPEDEEASRARLEEAKQAFVELKDYAAIFADYLIAGDQPLVVIENLRIDGLKLKLEDAGEKGAGHVFSNLSVRAKALSSNPMLYKKDSVIELGNNGLEDPTFHLKFTMNWSNPDPVHRLDLRINDLPPELVLKYLDPGDKLAFTDGAIQMASKTSFRASGLRSNTRIQLQGMNIAPVRPGEKILGLDGDLFCRGLTEFLKDSPLETVVKIRGAYDRLSLEIDDKGLLDSVREGIQRTGNRLLQEQFDQQLAQARALADEKLDKAQQRLDRKKKKLENKLKGKVGDELGEAVGKDLEGLLGDEEETGKDLLDTAEGLLGGMGKKKDAEKKEKKEKDSNK
ncbi:MAG: hypothetical protein ACYTG7_23030, partial [Planctomycetota bacterium]